MGLGMWPSVCLSVACVCTSITSFAHAEREHVSDVISLSARFPGADPLAVDLLGHMLCFSPQHRIMSEAALAHPYFVENRYHDPEDEVRGL